MQSIYALPTASSCSSIQVPASKSVRVWPDMARLTVRSRTKHDDVADYLDWAGRQLPPKKPQISGDEYGL